MPLRAARNTATATRAEVTLALPLPHAKKPAAKGKASPGHTLARKTKPIHARRPCLRRRRETPLGVVIASAARATVSRTLSGSRKPPVPRAPVARLRRPTSTTPRRKLTPLPARLAGSTTLRTSTNLAKAARTRDRRPNPPHPNPKRTTSSATVLQLRLKSAIHRSETHLNQRWERRSKILSRLNPSLDPS